MGGPQAGSQGMGGQQLGSSQMGGPQMSGPQMGGMGMGRQRGRRGGLQLEPVQVEDIVQSDVVTAQRDTPISTVVSKMAEEDVGAVVVVENDEPVGIVTDRKIALALEEDPDISQRQADEFAQDDLLTGTTDMSVFDVTDELSDADVRRLPIVDDDGSLEGIVTLDDVLVLLGSELSKAGDVIQSQSPRL